MVKAVNAWVRSAFGNVFFDPPDSAKKQVFLVQKR